MTGAWECLWVYLLRPEQALIRQNSFPACNQLYASWEASHKQPCFQRLDTLKVTFFVKSLRGWHPCTPYGRATTVYNHSTHTVHG